MPSKKIEEIILEELGITLRREIEGGGSSDEIIVILKKYDKWFKSIAQRIIQQEKQIQQLTHAIKTGSTTDLQKVVVPIGKPQAISDKKKVLKCADCGTILQYATKNKCPVCGSNNVAWTED